jgi:hypothetical protein
MAQVIVGGTLETEGGREGGACLSMYLLLADLDIASGAVQACSIQDDDRIARSHG